MYTCACMFRGGTECICDDLLDMFRAVWVRGARSTRLAMERWAAKGRPRAEEEEPRSKRQTTARPEELVRGAVKLMAKLSLKNALEIRELQSAVMVTYLMPKEAAIVQEAQAAIKNYVDTATRARNGEGQQPQGEPHVHCWAALVARAAKDTNDEKDRKALIDHATETTEPEQLLDKVFVCKLKKAFDKNTMKLQISAAAKMEAEMQALDRVLRAAGGKQKRGQAPKSGLERDLQDALDKIEGKETGKPRGSRDDE